MKAWSYETIAKTTGPQAIPARTHLLKRDWRYRNPAVRVREALLPTCTPTYLHTYTYMFIYIFRGIAIKSLETTSPSKEGQIANKERRMLTRGEMQAGDRSQTLGTGQRQKTHQTRLLKISRERRRKLKKWSQQEAESKQCMKDRKNRRWSWNTRQRLGHSDS